MTENPLLSLILYFLSTNVSFMRRKLMLFSHASRCTKTQLSIQIDVNMKGGCMAHWVSMGLVGE